MPSGTGTGVHRGLSRRSTLAGLGAAALAVPALTAGRVRAAGQITVADPGGPYSPGYRKAFYDPFEKETGIKVVNVAREAEPTAQFTAMVQTQSYIWDVCTLTLSARDILAKKSLLDPIGLKPGEVPGLLPEALTPAWLGVDTYSTVLGYRTDRLAGHVPQDWADFWDVVKCPGRRAMRKSPIDTLEQALMADGVPIDKLYPIDMDRAFRSLDRIRPHVAVWWTGGAQSTQLLQSGEVDMLPLWNARVQAAIDGGVPAAIGWNQGLYSIEGWGIPKGCPRADDARRFVRFCAAPERQAVFTEQLAYGPTNLKAYDTIPADRARTLPTYPPNLKLMTIAQEGWWSANRAAATERFNAWILG